MHKPGQTLTKTWRLHASLISHRYLDEGQTWQKYYASCSLSTPANSFPVTINGDEDGSDFVYTLTWEGGSSIEVKRVPLSESEEYTIEVDSVVSADFTMTGQEDIVTIGFPPQPSIHAEFCEDCPEDWCEHPDYDASYDIIRQVSADGAPTGKVRQSVTAGEYSDDYDTKDNITGFDGEQCEAGLTVNRISTVGSDMKEVGTVSVRADHCTYPDLGTDSVVMLDNSDPPVPWKQIDYDYDPLSATLITTGTAYNDWVVIITYAAGVRLAYEWHFPDLPGIPITILNYESVNTYRGDPNYDWDHEPHAPFSAVDGGTKSITYLGKATIHGLDVKEKIQGTPPTNYCIVGYDALIMVDDQAPGACRLEIQHDTLPALGQPYFPEADPPYSGEVEGVMDAAEASVPGHDYELDDVLSLANIAPWWLGGTVKVISLDENKGIKGVQVVTGGHDYTDLDQYSEPELTGGHGHGATIDVTAVSTHEGVPCGFGDWRLPVALSDWDWNALKIVHNNNVLLSAFGDTAPWPPVTGATITKESDMLKVVVAAEDVEVEGHFAPVTALTVATDEDDDHIHVTSTAGFPTAGDLQIDEINTISYTGKTSSTFTGCTGVLAHTLAFPRKVELVGPWLSHYRFVKVQWLPKITAGGAVDTAGSMRLNLGDKYWDLTYKAADYSGGMLHTEIDLCRPHGTCAPSAEQQSWLDYGFPRSAGQLEGGVYVAGSEANAELYDACVGLEAGQGRTVENEWYWGVGRVNEVKLTDLSDGRTYLLADITGVIKSYSRLVTTNQWGWRYNRHGDDLAKVRSGLFADTEGGARFSCSDEILGWIITDGMVAAEITGEWWNQQCGEECCGSTHQCPPIGYLVDDDWYSNLLVWPRRPERVPLATIVVTPAEATAPEVVPYLSNLLSVRNLEGPPPEAPFWRSITTQLALKGVAATDWFVYAACGGYLSSSESFHLVVTKRFGHDIHGLAFDGLGPAKTKQLDVTYGETTERVTTDTMGAFDLHVPYLGDSATVEVKRVSGTELVDMPVRQRRMTFGGLVLPPIAAAGLSSDQDEAGRVFLVT